MTGREPAGPATDAAGYPVLDPTRNVLGVLAAVDRRQDDLRDAESRHLRELMKRDNEHAQALRVAEAARIDANRSQDQDQVRRAAEVAATAVQTLATQVPITADAVRTSLATALDPILKDIQELRRAQYEQQGQKAQVSEGRAHSGSLGLWIGLVTAGFFGFASLLVSLAVLVK